MKTTGLSCIFFLLVLLFASCRKEEGYTSYDTSHTKVSTLYESAYANPMPMGPSGSNPSIYVTADKEIAASGKIYCLGPVKGVSDIKGLPDDDQWGRSAPLAMGYGYIMCYTNFYTGESEYVRFYISRPYNVGGVFFGYEIRYEFPYLPYTVE